MNGRAKAVAEAKTRSYELEAKNHLEMAHGTKDDEKLSLVYTKIGVYYQKLADAYAELVELLDA